MCGIFIARKVAKDLTKDFMSTLYYANEDRGGRGVGLNYLYKVTDDPELKDFRYHWSFKGMVFDDVWHEQRGCQQHLIAGHTVAPTHTIEPQSVLQCRHVTDGVDYVIHPLEINYLYFAHNGIITNPDHLNTEHQMYKGSDSSALFSDIYDNYDDDGSLPDAIATTMGKAEGQAGCWLIDTLTHNTYVWRNMSSIWFGLIDGRMVYSSTRIEGLDMMLPDGIVYEVYHNISPKPVAYFTPKSIY